MLLTVLEIAEFVQGRVIGNGQTRVEAVTNIEAPVKGAITFIQDAKYLKRLEATEIACLIVPPTIESSVKTLIQVDLPKLAWAKILEKFYPPPIPSKTISNLASISKSARLGKDVTIEPFACVGDEAEIGDFVVIHAHTYVGPNVKIGNQTVLHSGVKVYERCVIGNEVTIHAGAIVGSDGFGYVATPEAQIKIPQVGNVVIGNHVEIGACTTIDRATMGSTRIGDGCKLDNLVQIAHNVILGPHTVISSQTGISGSSKLGAHVTLGGKVGVGDHVEIGDGTMVGAGAGLPSGKKVPEKQVLFGEPARPYQEARKQIAAQLRSAEMYEELKRLRKRVDELEKKSQAPVGI